MIRRLARSRLPLALIFAAGAVAACDAVLGLGVDKKVRAEPDAAIDAAPEAAETPVDAGVPDTLPASCTALGVPDPPAQDDDGGADRTVVLAFARVDFGDKGASPATGLNLDHVCTCPMPESCVPRSSDAGRHCDLDGGIDNSGNSLLAYYAGFQAPLDDVVNNEIDAGNFTILFRIGNYNGLANDSDVDFAFFTSSGTPLDDAGNHVAPSFDGGTWDIDPSSAIGDAGPEAIAKYHAVRAYVNNHVLVADMGDFPISFGTGRGVSVALKLDMQLSGVVIRGTLEEGANGFTMTGGLLAGRWSTRSILLAVGSLPSQLTNGQKICEDPTAFGLVRTKVCNAADIAFDRAHDSTSLACNAVSVGMTFDGVPAALGGMGPSVEAGTPCESLLDPQNQDCP